MLLPLCLGISIEIGFSVVNVKSGGRRNERYTNRGVASIGFHGRRCAAGFRSPARLHGTLARDGRSAGTGRSRLLTASAIVHTDA
jgi:hypothetical protein